MALRSLSPAEPVACPFGCKTQEEHDAHFSAHSRKGDIMDKCGHGNPIHSYCKECNIAMEQAQFLLRNNGKQQISSPPLPPAEPVAWRKKDDAHGWWIYYESQQAGAEPLYAAPPHQPAGERVEGERVADLDLIAVLHNAWPQIRAALEAMSADAERLDWLITHYGIAHGLDDVKPRRIPCPDNIQGCLVAHYAPITVEEVKAAIDEARKGER